MPSMRDENCLRRQWALLQSLAGRRAGLTIREMAEELGVTGRTIRRDLEVFRSVGFPLEESVGEFGRKTWNIKGSRERPALEFNFDEAVALYIGRRMLGQLEGTPFGEAAGHAFQKIRAVLGPGALDYIERFLAMFHETGVGLRDYAPKSEMIDDLRSAIEDRKAARLLYRSDGAHASTYRDVHPSGIIHHRGALYLVALDPSARKIKHYKLDRIEEVEVGTALPGRPADLDLAAHMASAFAAYKGDDEPTEVRVRFNPAAARYVQETRWHQSQRVTPGPDGSVEARFWVSGTAEIKSWILGFGAKAVVLEPESLRREIARELEQLAVAYREPPDDGGQPPENCDSPPLARRREGRRIGQTTSRES